MTAYLIWAVLGASVPTPDIPQLSVTATASSVTEYDVVASVLAFHPTIQASVERRRAGEAELLSARGGFDPRIRLQAEAVPTGYYDYRFFNFDVAQPTPFWGIEAIGGYRLGVPQDEVSFAPYNENLETLDRGEARVGVRVPLYRGGPIDERRATIRKAEFATERLGAEVRVQRLDLARQGVAAYWTWRAAVAKLRVAERLREIAAARDKAVGRRVTEGNLAPIERVEATRALRSREQRVVDAGQKVRLAAIKLGLFLRNEWGDPVSPGPEAAAPLSPTDIELDPRRRQNGRARALGRRPELVSLSRKLSELDVQVDLTSNQLFPKIDFKAALSKDFGGTNNDEGPDRIEELDPTELKLGVTIELPALLRESRGQLSAARARTAEIRQKLRFTKDKLLVEVDSAWVLLETATRNAEIAVELRELAEQVAAGERRRFEEGSTDLFQVFLRESQAGEAASKAIDALATQHAAEMIFRLTTCRSTPAHQAAELRPC